MGWDDSDDDSVDFDGVDIDRILKEKEKELRRAQGYRLTLDKRRKMFPPNVFRGLPRQTRYFLAALVCGIFCPCKVQHIVAKGSTDL